MLKSSMLKRNAKRMLSLLLTLAVMFSLAVPFTVHAEETPSQAATDENIYALLYIKDTSKTTTDVNNNFQGYKTSSNLELVFQNNPTPEAGKVHIHTYSKFAGTRYHTSEVYLNSNSPNVRNSNYMACPWFVVPTKEVYGFSSSSSEFVGRNVISVDFKDEIAPTYIASWFYGFQRIREFKHLTNLKTHNCKDMSYAFYCSTSTNWQWDTPEVYELNLSHFDTSSVEQIDNFIRLNSLIRLNVSGFNLQNVKYMTGFIALSENLTDINFTDFDVSKVNQITSFIRECGALESVDLGSFNPTSVYDFTQLFRECRALKNITFPEGFSPGRDYPVAATEAPAGYDGLTFTSGGKTYIAGSGGNRVRLGNLFQNCEALEEIDFANWDLYFSDPVDNAMSSRYYEVPSMFAGCKSLRTIKNMDHLIIEENSASTWTHRYMFDGCESLESVDFSNSKTFIGGLAIFRGCKNLRSVDFSGFGHNWWKTNWNYYQSMKFNETENNIAYNIFEGCEEISEVHLSQYYPPNNQSVRTGYTIGYGSSYPTVDRTWIKIAQPEIYTTYTKSNGTTTGTYQYPVSTGESTYALENLTDSKYNLVPINTTKSTEELFKDFQPNYAGTWVAVSKITLNAKGGTPAQQALTGARGMTLDYDENDITTPTRNGYKFKGWFYEDEEGVEHELQNHAVAESWTYYAKWEPIKYNIVLHSNEATDQTTTISNVDYDEFVALHGSTFTSSDPNKILAGWNTQASGNGTDFAANESVDKLTTIDGATIDLYAMWRIPDAIITFNSHGGTEVAQRDYTLSETENVLYGHLSEPVKDGYTFVGWFTEPNGEGRKVVMIENDPSTETAYVSGSHTLHAYWQPMPVVTFKLNGGEIKGNTEDFVKVIDYGQAIGSVPTPSYGSQTFLGWYTGESGGTLVTNIEQQTATGNVTYNAHWGWKPKFETNGGSYVTEPNYATQSSSVYSIGTLPEVTRANYTFTGWYIGDTNTPISNANNELLPAYATSVDLAQGAVFKAHWERDATADVTLDPNGGSYKANGANVTETKVYTQVYVGEEIGELPTPTKEHADFAGWYDDVRNEKYTYASTIDRDVTLTAHWTDHSCTVTFDPTDGEMAGLTTYTIAAGKTFTYLPGANCVEVNGATSTIKKSFDGWYTEPNGGGTKLTTETQITGNITYYANWVDNKRTDSSYSSTIRWGTLSSGDVTNVGDTLVFHPQGDGNVAAHLTVDFTLLSNNQLPKNNVRITLPKELFLGWNDEDVTSVNDTFTNFDANTSEDGKSFILTNNKDFNSTTIESVYTVDPMAVKGGYTDENGVYQNYYNKTFNVKIELWDAGQEKYVVYQERDLGVEFHTEVHTQVVKDQSTASLEWYDSWGPKPSDADEYFYVIWNLKSNNINSNQPYQLSWSEKTVHDGSVVYAPDLDKWSDEYSSDSSNLIQVVTKHPRKEAMEEGAWANVYNEAILNVKWKSGYVEQFRTTGKASAFVGEILDDGARSLSKYIPEFGTQSKHYVYGGQDLILNSDAASMNELKYNIIYDEDENTDNPGWTAAGEMDINPRTYVFSDGVKGRNDVLISGAKDTDSASKNSWNASDQTQLDDGDYYFTSLNIRINEYDSVMLNDDGTKKHWASPYQNNNIYDYNNLTVYIRKMGSNDFETLKTFYRSDLIPVDAGEGGYEVMIDLPADTVGYKVEYTSNRYATEFKIDTGLKLKDTRKIHSLTSTHANAGKHTIIKNKAQVDIKRDGETDIVCESKQFNPWLSSYELTLSESELRTAKSCLNQKTMKEDDKPKYFTSDEVASTIEFPVAITGWTYSKNQLGYIKRVKSGTFHDLLPYGFLVDKSKIIVCGRTAEHCAKFGKIAMNSQTSNAYANSYSTNATLQTFTSMIPSDYYSVRFVDNWEGSGQTMMIIDINCPEDMVANGFVVYYKCKSTINNLHINGTTPKNYVAFTDTTPEQSVPETRAYTRDNLDDTTVKALFASVDTNQTAYCHGTTTLDTPNVYQYGADSNVLTEGADIARHQVVGLNTDYSYSISYEGSTSTKTQQLVIFDVIERQIGGSSSQWEGAFQSIDVSKIRKQPSADASDGTCAPEVYYLSSDTIAKDAITKEMFDLDYELNGAKIWTTTPPENEKVVAVAIDCRKTSTGADFELGIRQGVDLTIHMTSPDDESQSDIETYNEAVITGFNPEIGKEINVSALTSVTLRFLNPTFVKSAFPASGTQDNPESVVQGSVLDYVLTIKNPDPELPMNNIVMVDEFPLDLVPNNAYKVRFNDGASISIDNTARVGYTLTTGKNASDQDVRVFTATIDVLDPDEKVEITIPVKVNLPKNSTITNEAKITSINDVSYSNITSNKTYHVVTGVKAKVLKVNSKDEPLTGATLEIYEKNDTNWDAATGKLKAGATPLNLENNGTSYGTSFTSGTEVSHFDVAAGEYILRETAVPANSGYRLAEDIPFTINVEGIIYVDGEPVNYVKMVDEPAYKVIFHENKPNGTDEEIQKIFKIYEPLDLDAGKVTHFYDIPEWAGDEYVFAGWYHNDGYTESETPDSAVNTASNFESDTFTERDGDYHLYAKWIAVGTVNKSDEDTNIISSYRGFGLAGVQVRNPDMYDSNFNNEVKPGGLRFVTSLSESLLSQIDALSATDVDGVPVEYGYAVGTEKNIKTFTEHYNLKDLTQYKLQYKGANVNGIDTTGQNDTKTAETDYRYITNVNCTSRVGGVSGGVVAEDHRNFGNSYRLYTLVVTYDDAASANKRDDKIDARAYIRYYDANGKLRVFYNDYGKNKYYGGCLCSFNQVSTMALHSAAPANEEG